MIPEICANCGKGVNVVGEDAIIGTVCLATPVKLWKEPGEYCGTFVTASNPPVVTPDGQPVSGPVFGADGETPAEVQDGPSDGERGGADGD